MRTGEAFLTSYLREHQSMGVYLHGEMIYSRVRYEDKWFHQDLLHFILGKVPERCY